MRVLILLKGLNYAVKTELLMIYLENEGYIVSSDPKKNNNTDLFAPKIFYYESIAPKTKKFFIVN